MAGWWGEAFFPQSPGTSLDPTQGLAREAAELAWSAGCPCSRGQSCLHITVCGAGTGVRGQSEFHLYSSGPPPASPASGVEENILAASDAFGEETGQEPLISLIC